MADLHPVRTDGARLTFDTGRSVDLSFVDLFEIQDAICVATMKAAHPVRKEALRELLHRIFVDDHDRCAPTACPVAGVHARAALAEQGGP